jgi:hypothetical protein
VSYVHFMCESHQVVRTEGLWSETFYPGTQALKALDAAALAEVTALFPELMQRRPGERRQVEAVYGALARTEMSRADVTLVTRAA